MESQPTSSVTSPTERDGLANPISGRKSFIPAAKSVVTTGVPVICVGLIFASTPLAAAATTPPDYTRQSVDVSRGPDLATPQVILR